MLSTLRTPCLELTIKTPKRCQWLHSGVFIVNFEHIPHLFFGVSTADFKRRKC